MYVNTNNPVFAYQVIGGIRPGSQGAFGITNGVANVGLFMYLLLTVKLQRVLIISLVLVKLVMKFLEV